MSLGAFEVNLDSAIANSSVVGGALNDGTANFVAPMRGKITRVIISLSAVAVDTHQLTLITPAGTFAETLQIQSLYTAGLPLEFEIDKFDPANFLHEGECLSVQSDGAGSTNRSIRLIASMIPA